MSLGKRAAAEVFGTFWLVFGGCGSAVLAAGSPASELVPYICAQLVGAALASSVLYLIARGATSLDVAARFASNGYGAHSPGATPWVSLRSRSVSA